MRLPTRGTKVAEKYQLVEAIGRGGMGVVGRAYAESLGLHCALKMALPGFGAERERTRLLREARTAAKLRSPYTWRGPLTGAAIAGAGTFVYLIVVPETAAGAVALQLTATGSF